MNNILSVHWLSTHGRGEDLDYMNTLGPHVLKCVDCDGHRVQQAWDAASYPLTIEPEIFWRKGAPSKQPAVRASEGR